MAVRTKVPRRIRFGKVDKKVPVLNVDPGARYRYPAMPGWQHSHFPELLRRALLLGAGQLRNKLQRFLLWGDVIAAGIADLVQLGRTRLRGLLGRESSLVDDGTTTVQSPDEGAFEYNMANVNIKVTGERKLMIFAEVSAHAVNIDDLYFSIATGRRTVQDFSFAGSGANSYFLASGSTMTQFVLVTEESIVRAGFHNYVFKIHGTANAAADLRYSSASMYITEI
jgi:hypothetical protein